jgi:hypothetical protein
MNHDIDLREKALYFSPKIGQRSPKIVTIILTTWYHELKVTNHSKYAWIVGTYSYGGQFVDMCCKIISFTTKRESWDQGDKMIS